MDLGPAALEINSPNDRLSESIALETDYRAVGVPEIVFIERMPECGPGPHGGALHPGCKWQKYAGKETVGQEPGH